MNITNIPAPRVPFIDERTGQISREWFRFLNNQFVLTGSGQTSISTADLELTPASTADDYASVFQAEIDALKMTPPVIPDVPSDYGSFYDTTTQTAAAINTAYPITFNTVSYTRGIRRGATTSQIFCNRPGIYNFAFSIQFDKSAGGTGLAHVWARKNGVDIADSASQVRLQSSNSELFCAANLYVEMFNGDYFELMWATDDTSMILAAFAAAAPVPAIPSVILTVNQVNL